MTQQNRFSLVLASGSPRRQEFLIQLGLPYTVQVANIDETPLADEKPAAIARRLAEAKARAVAQKMPQSHVLVIAADTVVALGDESLAKPADADEARAMLLKLRNRPHQVITAVSVAETAGNRQLTQVNTTDVFMRNYSDEELAAYIATGDPFDKAGGYAVQHSQFAPVARLQGCLSCVIGLPLGDLLDLLGKFGVEVTTSISSVCEQQMTFSCCRRQQG